MFEDNINYLNPHLNEICTMYYVWKNQIYSKYVGFCHYRRFFSDLGKHSIIKCGIHCLVFIRINLKSYCPEFDFKLKKLFEYLCNTNKFNINKLNDYFNNDKLIDLPWKLSYICEWDKFNEACELYFGFLDTLFTNFKDIKDTYFEIAKEEIAYRNLAITPFDSLKDSFETSLSIYEYSFP